MAFEPNLLDGGMADAPTPPSDEGSLFVDAPKAVFSGAVDLTAQGAGLIAQPDSAAAHLRDVLNAVKDDVDASMSPANRRARDAEIIPGPGGQSVFTSPGTSVVMKGSQMLPMLLGAFMLPQGWAGVAAGSALYGTQGAAQQLNESRKQIVAMPDDALQEKSGPYRALREQYDEGTAKEKLLEEQNDVWALLSAGAGGAIGGGALAHALKGQGTQKFLRALGTGLVEGGVGEGVAGVGGAVGEQIGGQNVGLRGGFDVGEIGRRGVNAAGEGAFVGGAFGGVSGMQSRAALKAKTTGKLVDEIGAPPDQKLAVDKHFEPTDTVTPQPPVAPPVPPAVAQGPLSQQIAAERARLAAEPPPAAPPVTAEVPPVTPAPVEVVPQVGPPVAAPIDVPPPVAAPPVAPGPPPLTAGEVNAAIVDVPLKATAPLREQPIPMPPTDRQVVPPRKKAPPERTAVPLAEPPDPDLEALNRAVVPRETITPQGKEVGKDAPLTGAEVVDALAAAPKKPIAGALKIAEPMAKLVKAEPGKPRVFRAADSEGTVRVKEKLSAEQEAATVVLRRQNELASEAERKRQARDKGRAGHEETAKKSITERLPKDAEQLEDAHSIEQAAMGKPSTGRESARQVVKTRALEMLIAAENDGVRVPNKTPWSKELVDQGIKDPTPYLSRLIQIKKFLDREKNADRLFEGKPESKKQTYINQLYATHIGVERAIRRGDLAAAAEPRLTANADMNAAHPRTDKTKELEMLMAASAADEAETKANTVKAKRGGDGESYSVNTDNKFKYINDPAQLNKGLQAARHRFVETRKQIDMREQAAKNAETTGKTGLATMWRKNVKIMRELNARAADEVKQYQERLKELAEDGEAPDRVMPQEGVERKTAREVLQKLHDDWSSPDYSPKQRAQADLLQQVIRKLIEVVGDQPIHLATDDAFFEHNTSTSGKTIPAGTEGLYRSHRKGKLAGGERGDIWIRRDLMDTVEGPRILIHEVVHSAVWHAIEHNPEFHADLIQLYNAAREAWTTPEARVKHGTHWYGLTNVHEFVAEALSNPKFQRFLMDTRAPGLLTRKYGLDKGTSLWRTLANAVARAFGFGQEHASILDVTLHLSDQLMAYEPPSTGRTLAQLQAGTHMYASEAYSLRDLPDRVKASARANAPHIVPTLRSKLRTFGHKLTSNTQLGQILDKYVPEKGGTKLARIMANMAQEKERILDSGDKKLVSDMAALQRKYAAGDTWDRFGSVLHDETMAGVYADRPLANQKHLGKNDMQAWQAKAQYAELAARYSVLPEDVKAMRTRLHDYFRKRQNDQALARLQAIVRALNEGVPDDALAQRIFDKKLDPAEEAVLKRDAVFAAIRNARMLNKVAGPYVPLMRHGDHVVSGTYHITSPGNARRLNDDGEVDANGGVFEFGTRDEAKTFAEKQDVKVLKVQKVYTEPTTGERWALDDDGEKHKLTKTDASYGQAVEKYRVHLQTKHLEFFESEMEARRTLKELRARTDMTIDGLHPKRWEPGGANSSFMSETFNRVVNSLQQRKGFKELDKAGQRELVQQLQEASLQALGSTRAASRRLPRTYVAGASDNIQKSTALYASATAGYLARLRFQPEMDAQLKALTKHADDYRYEADDRTQPRGQILTELKARLYALGEPEPYGWLHKAGNRLLQLSFLDKLASPAFHAINAMEPWTISMPVMGGRHGVGRTINELNKAYRDLGALSAVQAGIGDTVRAFKSDQGLTDYVRRYEERLRKAPDGQHITAMVKQLYDLGLVSRDAGLELGRMADPGGNILGRGLDRADLMARQVGVAIESINRLVTATAAYRLEYAKTKDHAAATEYATTTVHDTMGDYSGWNAPPMFKHPIGRLALQFKKYAQKTYYLLGKMAAASLRGDREAMKAFAGVMATHAVLAGGLGLPLEAVKASFIAAGLLGATNSDYGDFEQWVRKQAALGLGAAGGQIATRGLPRYLGVDLSGRTGMQSLILGIDDGPKSRKPDDVLAWALKNFAGAPFSMLAEYPAGIEALWKGDVAEATRILMPIKMYADSVQAYQRATLGKRTPSGRQSLEPYSVGEAITKAIGFTPGRDAETGEMRGAITGDQRRTSTERTKLVGQWVTARPEEKASIWREIQRWNEGQEPAARVKMKDLTEAQQRRGREDKSAGYQHGYRTSKRDSFLREQESYYNFH